MNETTRHLHVRTLNVSTLMANNDDDKLELPTGSILESDSPEPTLLKVICIDKYE